jgi:hypothetical protein
VGAFGILGAKEMSTDENSLKIYETAQGIFYSAIPPQKIVATHPLKTHTFQASMEIVNMQKDKVYLRDLKTGGFYPMKQKDFFDLLKNAVIVSGMVTARWGWHFHPDSVSLVYVEQVIE